MVTNNVIINGVIPELNLRSEAVLISIYVLNSVYFMTKYEFRIPTIP
jgi:hypothetical protein